MKTLYLFRHAKSDWSAPGDADRDRPLSRRGIKAAGRMGAWLATVDAPPHHILCSPARRTHDTVRRMLDAAHWDIPIDIQDGLYETGPEHYLQSIQALASRVDRAMLVGHEPTCSECASQLIGGGTIRFPTATMARIDLVCATWADVRPGDGELVWLMPTRFRPAGRGDD